MPKLRVRGSIGHGEAEREREREIASAMDGPQNTEFNQTPNVHARFRAMLVQPWDAAINDDE